MGKVFTILLGVCFAFLGACTSTTPTAFRVTNDAGRPVAGAHARIILLDAGMPLPLRSGTFEEVAKVRSVGGAISDADGVVELPVVGMREHLIEVEGPVLRASDPRSAPTGVWVYRPKDASLVARGEDAIPLRIERVE